MESKLVFMLLTVVSVACAATLDLKPEADPVDVKPEAPPVPDDQAPVDNVMGPFPEDDVQETEPSHGKTWEGNDVDELALVQCSFHGEYIRHPGNCGKFYQCSWGTPYLHNCPSGLYFNTNLNVCDWPKNVDCNNDVACITRRFGRISSSDDDAVSTARCPKGSVPINCECNDPRRCDGNSVSGRDCHAINSAGSPGTRAIATCVSANAGEFVNAISGNFEISPSVRCPAGYRMINCFLRNAWNHVKFAFPLRYWNKCEADTTCSAGRGCYLQVICQRVSGLYAEGDLEY